MTTDGVTAPASVGDSTTTGAATSTAPATTDATRRSAYPPRHAIASASPDSAFRDLVSGICSPGAGAASTVRVAPLRPVNAGRTASEDRPRIHGPALTIAAPD